MIRMNNLQATGWDLSDLKHIELDAQSLARYRLKHGDLLFNRTNSKELVGKCEVFKEDGDWVFASYLIRVQLAAENVLPEFVSSFLNSPAGRIQIDQVSRQIAGMSNVNAEELKRLEVPLPSLDIQRRLVAELDDARRRRDGALTDAGRLVASFEPWAIAQIGMVQTVPTFRNYYAVRRTSLSVRIDPFYYAPEFVEIEREVRSVAHAPLGDLVDFSNITWNPSEHPDTTFRYIEISGVDRRRGKAKASEVLVTDAPSRARMLVEPNDILVSLTRPHHGSIALLDEGHRGCIASTGFAVIRHVDSTRIDRRFLWATLRLSICLKQMLRRASGGNYPAITQDELANVLIPVPTKPIQQAILKEIMRRSDEADRLESHAESTWDEARTRFEQQLLRMNAA